MRTFLIILLILSSFIVFAFIGAGSHGNISMKNKETAKLVFSGILFLLTAVFNGISLKAGFSKTIKFITLSLNLVCAIVLLIFFIGMFNPSLKNEIDLIAFTIIIGLEIILISKTLMTDFKKLYKS
ncbi:MAG: hypothetical protein ABJM06_14800 [Gilvibacter sp.]